MEDMSIDEEDESEKEEVVEKTKASGKRPHVKIEYEKAVNKAAAEANKREKLKLEHI